MMNFKIEGKLNEDNTLHCSVSHEGDDINKMALSVAAAIAELCSNTCEDTPSGLYLGMLISCHLGSIMDVNYKHLSHDEFNDAVNAAMSRAKDTHNVIRDMLNE